MQSVQWDDVTATFAPFRGTAVGAVRADAYFNLSNSHFSGWKFRAKCNAYPLLLLRRALPAPVKVQVPKCDVLMLSDYAAEPGFGTLRPLLNTTLKIGFIGTHDVLAARRSELSCYSNVTSIAIDPLALSCERHLFAHWRRSKHALDALAGNSTEHCRQAILSASTLIRALLVRAFLYEVALAEVVQRSGAKAIVLHNDFTTVSNVAVSVAKKVGISECTLQHGFPSQEYFPTSSSRYLVWGSAFADYMTSIGNCGSTLEIVGAPRLDSLAAKSVPFAATTQRKPKVLFLSQTHTHLFPVEEHRQVLKMLEDLCASELCDVSVRLHPQENRAAYESYPRLSRAITSGASLPHAIESADVVISVNSTALLEAMLLKKPCLQLYASSMQDRLGILRLEASAQAASELEALVQQAADPAGRIRLLDHQSELLQQYVYQPGRGTENAWNAILSTNAGTALAG